MSRYLCSHCGKETIRMNDSPPVKVGDIILWRYSEDELTFSKGWVKEIVGDVVLLGATAHDHAGTWVEFAFIDWREYKS